MSARPLPDLRSDWVSLSDDLARGARAEGDHRWPAENLVQFVSEGVLGWVVPAEFGGAHVSAAELTFGYERLAAADLLSTFVLTQKNGAAQRIAGLAGEELKADVLPRLVSGELSATIGISHLTTSRQHLGTPAVSATPIGDDKGFVLDGVLPWVTAASQSDQILAGGTLADGRQILALVDTADPGVTCEPPAELLALSGSLTGPVRLSNVEVPAQSIVAGPVEAVMKQPHSGGGAGSVTTSALAVGVARAAIEGLESEAESRSELQEIATPLRATWSELMTQLEHATDPTRDVDVDAKILRQRANSLALRSSQAYLAASKGAGFVVGHSAERLTRQAMFFLVWSCPQPVVAANLREFACVN